VYNVVVAVDLRDPQTFRRAFNEDPGRLLAYGILSDTDNTGETVEAWYGEISFARQPDGSAAR